MRHTLLALVLSACITRAAAPTTPSTNRAIETGRYYLPDMSCEPVFTDAPGLVSSARCKTPRGQMLYCVASPASFDCRQLNAADKPAPPAPEPAKVDPPKPEPAKAEAKPEPKKK